MVSIDPGSRGTGIAVWENNAKVPNYGFAQHCNLEKKDWHTRTNALLLDCSIKLKLTYRTLGEYTPIFIEEPKFFDSYRGMTAARDDSLGKLIYFFGRLWQVILDIGFVSVFAVPIVQYRGQLNKSQIQARIKQRINKEYDSDHLADAVYLGLWVRGLVK